MKYVKKYWKKILCVIAIIIFPFLLELILFFTPVVSKFSNEAWFSFTGSYIGAVVTLEVMYITFKKSDEENKNLIIQQKKQHDIDRENEKLSKIIHVLLLDGYYFLDPDTVCENMDRFLGDLHYVQFDTLKFKYMTHKDEKLMDELLKLQMEEVKIINEMQENTPHVDSQQKAKDLKRIFMKSGLELSQNANLHREIIKVMYDNYLERVYEQYYL